MFLYPSWSVNMDEDGDVMVTSGQTEGLFFSHGSFQSLSHYTFTPLHLPASCYFGFVSLSVFVYQPCPALHIDQFMHLSKLLMDSYVHLNIFLKWGCSIHSFPLSGPGLFWIFTV